MPNNKSIFTRQSNFIRMSSLNIFENKAKESRWKTGLGSNLAERVFFPENKVDFISVAIYYLFNQLMSMSKNHNAKSISLSNSYFENSSEVSKAVHSNLFPSCNPFTYKLCTYFFKPAPRFPIRSSESIRISL